MSVFAFILLLPFGHRRSRMGIGWAEAAVGGRGRAERSRWRGIRLRTTVPGEEYNRMVSVKLRIIILVQILSSMGLFLLHFLVQPCFCISTVEV